MKLLSLFIPATVFLPAAYAWGVEGHGIVATIAQMYVDPGVLKTVCDLLHKPNCHLAPISTWADDHRTEWSAPMHYINPLGDNPGQLCCFPGKGGWDGKKNVNVLDAIKNVTSVIQRWVHKDASDAAASEALKFLVHFVGDMHQPMHLVAKAKGGNGVNVTFGRKTTLHKVWDNSLLEKFMGETPRNYTQPLSNRMVESVLTGEKYDPYIRRIMWEGVLGSWKPEVTTWFRCASTAEAEFPSQDRCASTGEAEFPSQDSSQRVMGVDINPDGPVVCPFYWAKPIHKINCNIAWPLDLNDSGNYNLDTPKYAGEIGKQMIVERLLAQGGVRLAGILNYAFASK